MTPPDRKVPSEKRQKRRSELLDAAAKVFYSHGYAAATVQDIADELGLLKGSLYHYMSSKEDLLYDLLQGTHDALWEILEHTMSIPHDVGAAERLWVYVYRQVEYNISNLARISIYYRDTVMLTGDRRGQIFADRAKHESFIAALITEATGIAPEEAMIAAMNLFATIIWTHRWYRPGKFDGEQVPRLCADFAVRGIVGALDLGLDPRQLELVRPGPAAPPTDE